MKLINKAILLVSPEPWNHVFVSKHHYATHLGLKGNYVFFLNPPSKINSIRETEFENVFSVSYTGFVRGLRFFPGILQKHFTKRKFNELQSFCNVKFDIIWSFDNSVFFEFSALPLNVLKISHIVDLNQDFQTEKAGRTADYCFSVTDNIVERLLNYNSKVFKINHGFNNQISNDSSIVLPGKSKIKALYAGNLGIPFIDWVLLQNVVNDNPTVDFIFVGPNSESFNQDNKQNRAKEYVLKCTNTFFVGRISPIELFKYQRSADILLVAYQKRFHGSQATNTHKMMEYLGSGKMIVATYTAEYDSLARSGFFMMSSNEDFPRSFQKTIDELEFWNSDQKKQMRRAFALDNTYEKQIQRIEAIIKSE